MAQRIQKWDILKFVLIFFVVFGHFSEQYKGMGGLFFFIYSFHMPLFIFVSGLFSKRTINEKRYDKIFTYFALFIFIKVILFVTRPGSEFNLLYTNGVPWYAFAIFAFCLITVFLRKLDPKYVFIFSIILACFAGYDKNLNDFLVSARIIVFYPFFYAGYVLDANKVAEVLNKKSIKICSVIVIVGYIVALILLYDKVSFLKPLLSGRNSFWTLDRHEELGLIFRLGYYGVAFVLGTAIVALIPDTLGKGTIAKLGGRSVQVYALHYSFIHLLYNILHIDDYMASIFPACPEIIILPLSVITILICSSKLLTPIFNLVLQPKTRK